MIKVIRFENHEFSQCGETIAKHYIFIWPDGMYTDKDGWVIFVTPLGGVNKMSSPFQGRRDMHIAQVIPWMRGTTEAGLVWIKKNQRDEFYPECQSHSGRNHRFRVFDSRRAAVTPARPASLPIFNSEGIQHNTVYESGSFLVQFRNEWIPIK